MMRFDTPPLDLQPTEVHSAHWVSLQSLLFPSLRTFERADISERTVRQKNVILRGLLQFLTGQMMFSAVRLQPSESLVCNATQHLASAKEHVLATQALWSKAVFFWFARDEVLKNAQHPLLLWGLTLGVIADFLEIFDSDATTGLWSWPTFTHWDIQICVWILTRSFRMQKLQEIRAIKQKSTFKGTTERVAGIENTTYSSVILSHKNGLKAGIAGAHALDGYFSKMKKALMLAFSVRLSAGILVLAVILQRYRQRR